MFYNWAPLVFYLTFGKHFCIFFVQKLFIMENYDIKEKARQDFEAKVGYTPEQIGTPFSYVWKNCIIYASSKRVIWALLEERRLNNKIISVSAVGLAIVVILLGLVFFVSFYTVVLTIAVAIMLSTAIVALIIALQILNHKRKQCQKIHQNKFLIQPL